MDAVLFDLDGTLIDSAQDISNCVNETHRRVGRPVIDDEIIKGFVGRGVLPLIEQAMEESAPPDVVRGAETRDAIALFMQLYETHCLDHTRLYPGILEVLDGYAGKSLAVVTNKAEKFTLKILEGLGVRDRFATVLGGDSLEERKPHPAPVLRVLERAAVRAERAVIVGDSNIDIAAGKAAGILTCGVLYGLRPEQEIREAGPDAIVSTAGEIPEWFI